MGVPFTSLTRGTDEVDGTTMTTASVAFQNNRLYLVSVTARGATDPNVDSITGGGITWVEILEVTTGQVRTALYRGRVTSGATTGTLTITLSGSGQGAWSVCESDGTEDTSGTNGSGAIVQSAQASATDTTVTVTLAAFASSTNTAFLCCGTIDTGLQTPEGGYTELDEVTLSGGGRLHTLHVTYKGSEDTTPSQSGPGNTFRRAVAVEVKTAAGGAPSVIRRSLLGVGV